MGISHALWLPRRTLGRRGLLVGLGRCLDRRDRFGRSGRLRRGRKRPRQRGHPPMDLAGLPSVGDDPAGRVRTVRWETHLVFPPSGRCLLVSAFFKFTNCFINLKKVGTPYRPFPVCLAHEFSPRVALRGRLPRRLFCRPATPPVGVGRCHTITRSLLLSSGLGVR